MHIPPHDQLQAVVRGLTTTTRDGQEMRLLTAERHFPANRDEVWDALTNPERVPRWMAPVSRRPAGRRPLPDRGQRRRRDPGLYAAGGPLPHLGVRRPDQLGRRHADHRRRPDPAAARAHRSRRPREVGAVRARSRRHRLGDGVDGHRRAPVLARHRTGPDPGVDGEPGGLGLPGRVHHRLERAVDRGQHRGRHRSRGGPRRRAALHRRPTPRAPRSDRVEAFDVLGDPVRRRILELLADGEQLLGGGHRDDLGGVRHRAAGRLDAAAGAARERLRRRTTRRPAPPVRPQRGLPWPRSTRGSPGSGRSGSSTSMRWARRSREVVART